MTRKYVFVDYINNEGRLSNSAENANQAIVSIANIFTKQDGKHDIIEEICNLYVGTIATIEHVKENNLIPENKLNEIKKNGTKNFVINKNGIHPLRPYDEVFEDENSMLEALNKQLERLEALGYPNDNIIKQRYPKRELKK